MSESAEKIIYVTTNGPESPEKATLPFKLANAGLALDQDVVLDGKLITGRGYAENTEVLKAFLRLLNKS